MGPNYPDMPSRAERPLVRSRLPPLVHLNLYADIGDAAQDEEGPDDSRPFSGEVDLLPDISAGLGAQKPGQVRVGAEEGALRSPEGRRLGEVRKLRAR